MAQVTKRKAKYKKRAPARSNCGGCKSYRASGNGVTGMCKKVQGPVHAVGYCNLYTRK